MKYRKQSFLKMGAFLREKREERGLSQTEVAEVLSVKPQFVSNWERGMSAPPLRLLRVVRKMYGIPDQELLGFMMNVKREEIAKSLGVRGNLT